MTMRLEHTNLNILDNLYPLTINRIKSNQGLIMLTLAGVHLVSQTNYEKCLKSISSSSKVPYYTLLETFQYMHQIINSGYSFDFSKDFNILLAEIWKPSSDFYH